MPRPSARRPSAHAWNDIPYWETRKSILGPLPQDEIGHENKRKTGAHVYFIHAADHGKIKIGTSKNPLKRMADLQAACGPLATLKLLGSIDGSYAVERLLHERFAAHRVSGEWFADEIMDECRELIALDAIYWSDGKLAA